MLCRARRLAPPRQWCRREPEWIVLAGGTVILGASALSKRRDEPAREQSRSVRATPRGGQGSRMMVDVFRSVPLRILQLIVGLALYGVGIAFMVRGMLGVSPWDVLTQGLAKTTGLEFGVVMFLISIVIFLLWIPLRQRPGVGTVFNILVVPLSAQATIWLLPEPSELWLRILFLAGGIWLIGVATAIYLGADFGPGPRDGLMTGLHARTGWPIWMVRTLLEIVVVITGWLLGGDAGIGTLAFALLIGPIVHLTLPWCSRAVRRMRAARTAPADAPAGEPRQSAKRIGR